MEWWTGSRSTRGRALRKRGVHVPRRQCSQCGGNQIRRSRTWRQWEWLLQVIRLYYFRCDDCRHRFLRFSLRGR
jgi:hypothetical protein